MTDQPEPVFVVATPVLAGIDFTADGRAVVRYEVEHRDDPKAGALRVHVPMQPSLDATVRTAYGKLAEMCGDLATVARGRAEE